MASDGMVEQPRIVSGGMVGDTYMRLAAMNELNMHYVSTHFMHPDDLLDVDRGAEEGWEVYKGGFEDYLKWLSAAAPDLRKQTRHRVCRCGPAVQPAHRHHREHPHGVDAYPRQFCGRGVAVLPSQ